MRGNAAERGRTDADDDEPLRRRARRVKPRPPLYGERRRKATVPERSVEIYRFLVGRERIRFDKASWTCVHYNEPCRCHVVTCALAKVRGTVWTRRVIRSRARSSETCGQYAFENTTHPRTAFAKTRGATGDTRPRPCRTGFQTEMPNVTAVARST